MSSRCTKVAAILFRSGAVIAALLGLGWCCLPVPPPLAPTSYSQRVFARDGQLLRLTLSADEKYRVHTSLEAISPDLIQATTAYEDRHFYRHPGVNPLAVIRAGLCSLTGQRGGGASTITMQLARVRYGLRTRTLRGKLIQMVRAMQIERRYTKREILEHYLNLAPYGGNIEGVEAASLIYFGKSSAKLTRHEAHALSVIPQNPRGRAPAQSTNPQLTAAQQRLSIGARQASPAAAFDLRAKAPRKFAAPHFVQRVLADHPTQRAITTTLDVGTQSLIERQITTYLAKLRQLGVKNAAALLVDHHSMEVLAQCGSADFFDEELPGQVDGTRSRRSPGSTLKPFIYALAMEEGSIHPGSILKDSPQSFAGYNPENFDGEFSGPISAIEALARSRNVPAVWLASQLKRPAFYDWLISAGVRLPHESGHYGLSLPLGGGEVTMEELVCLYAALGNGGKLRHLQRTRPVAAESGTRVLSPEAAFLALQMLGEVPRPDISRPAGDDGIYWKTGTSHGFRDAWAVGIFDHYVLAVWLGNFDGSRNPAVIGRTCAGPLFFQIIETMQARGLARPAKIRPPAGANLREVELCAVSGQVPDSCCTHRTRGWFVPGISPIAACEIHREVLIDAQSGLRVARDDGSRPLRREVYEFWPSDLLALFEKAGVPRRAPPPFLPGAESLVETTARSGVPPQIVTPASGQAYSLGEGQSIGLRALADADAAKLYWFVDKQFLGVASRGQTLPWSAPPGTYRLTALDDHGRAGISKVSIQAQPGR